MRPSGIMAVRHGESEANLAYRLAGDRPLVYERGDDEVTLTELGRTQAAALGGMLAALPEDEAPELVCCSPYRRALDTWEIAGREWGARPPVIVDDRLRDQEPGEFAGLNLAALRERFPGELARREAEGPYAYRPPGGESLADVTVRLRDFLADDLGGRADGRRLLIVAHDSVVLGLRHVLGGRPDTELAEVLAFAPVLNGSVSVWRAGELVRFNDVTHLAS
ncbi:histidine phosphatase family protein [Nonomuraea fastidiosa]|jgi:broad specificity phosphatase PhoE|uniref:histidine phosphatase family protein n=1 Tax=Nonomuraea TaxID=83681 RepID=UPI00342B2BA0